MTAAEIRDDDGRRRTERSGTSAAAGVRPLRVVVIGGGVAGTAAAVALRLVGADVTVFEAYEDPGGDVGSFISLAVNGQRGLDAIGCLERVRAHGFPVARHRVWSARGTLLGDAARGRRAEDTLLSVTLMRADLVRELRAAAVDAGAVLVLGERCVGLSEPVAARTARFDASRADGPVRVEFASGLAVEADLVVGADGIWSTVRRLLDPGAPSPVYAGLYAVSGRSRGVELGRHAEDGAFNMTFARRATFMHLRAPDGEIWWSAQVPSVQEPPRDGVGEREWLRRLAELVANDRVPAAIVAAATQVQGSSVLHRLAPVPVRHGGRVVLVGDAAHPVGAGQGASMAIEDALALASAVGTTTGTDRSAVVGAGHPAAVGTATRVGLPGTAVPVALAAYTRMRDERVDKMLKASDDNKDAKLAGPVAARVRDALMSVFFTMFYERATGWLYDYTPPVLPRPW